MVTWDVLIVEMELETTNMKDKKLKDKDKKSRDIYKKNLIKLMTFIKKLEDNNNVHGNPGKPS